MVSRSRLTEDQIAERLAAAPGWSRSDESITKTYEAPSFMDDIAFVWDVAEVTESRNHHPDIDIRHNRVTLALLTHYQGGQTAWEFDVAKAIDAF